MNISIFRIAEVTNKIASVDEYAEQSQEGE